MGYVLFILLLRELTFQFVEVNVGGLEVGLHADKEVVVVLVELVQQVAGDQPQLVGDPLTS